MFSLSLVVDIKLFTSSQYFGSNSSVKDIIDIYTNTNTTLKTMNKIMQVKHMAQIILHTQLLCNHNAFSAIICSRKYETKLNWPKYLFSLQHVFLIIVYLN